MKRFLRTLLSGFLLLAAVAGQGAEPRVLPSSPRAVRVDGDPREAFLFGAAPLPAWDAVTGVPDGSVRVFALAAPQGLYIALLSTEPDGGAGLLRPLPWSPPEEAVLGDWMGLRLGPPDSAVLFVLAPGGFRTVLRSCGLPAENPSPWQGADGLFGKTWAGEWLLPWEGLPSAPLRIEVLRGRKIRAGRQAQESLAQTSRGPAPGRWGGEGLLVARPEGIPEAESLRALRAYDVRPFVPAGEEAPFCRDAAPAGEWVTAWLESAPGREPVRLEAAEGLESVEVFRVHFRWQAGTREEIDALFPPRAAAGLGDVLAGDLLEPQPEQGFLSAGEPVRFYVRGRIPAGKVPATLEIPLGLVRGGRPAGRMTWRIETAPALPPPVRLAGVYYMTQEPSRWLADLEELKDHGFTAVTCPARDPEGWRRFQKAAAASGLDGSFALHPEAVPEGENGWAYVWDEPATRTQLAGARTRAEALRTRGLKGWAALAWPHTLGLSEVLDGAAIPPNLVPEAGRLSSPQRWIYVQALREDPFYNRVWAGLLARAPGLHGFWVFCYAPSRLEAEDDWKGPIVRYDALVAPGDGGSAWPTVPFEAFREGILDGRLLDALGPRAGAVLARFPGASEVRAGAYWKARERGWTFADLRRALVEAWARRDSVSGPSP